MTVVKPMQHVIPPYTFQESSILLTAMYAILGKKWEHVHQDFEMTARLEVKKKKKSLIVSVIVYAKL